MEPDHLDVDLRDAVVAGIQFVLAAAFGAWAWLLKNLGNRHLDQIGEVVGEIRELRKDVNRLAERVRVVEVRQDILHPDNR